MKDLLKEKIFNKKICIIFLICGFVYGIALPFFWGNNPLDPLGTMSILCENHRPAFWLWVLFVCGGSFLNTNYMYMKYKTEKKSLFIISVLALVAACGIALSLGHPVDSWNAKRIVHWVCTGVYVALLGLSVAGLGFANIKRDRRFGILIAIVLGTVVLFVAWLLILGKSAVLEMVPYAILQITLFLANFTDVFKLSKNVPSETIGIIK